MMKELKYEFLRLLRFDGNIEYIDYNERIELFLI